METNKIHKGLALDVIKTFPNKSINCVITSPPYWQLRDYGFSEQWGLEPTFEEYLEHLWSLMDEIWRVLKDDGTAWINMGDTYSTQGGQNTKSHNNKYDSVKLDNKMYGIELLKHTNLSSKCLMLLPHRFAIGCIERGWILRNDIVWAKRNGMPESVTDRFSKKHEYFFFMAKNQKYYFDLDGIRDTVNIESVKRELRGNRENTKYGNSKGMPDGVHANTMSKSRIYKEYDKLDAVMLAKKGKNPGDVSDFWDIPTQSSKKEHYATFNNKLIEKPIVAGCPKGGIILDPFCGTGTTLFRAYTLDRKFIGIEGSEKYFKEANKISKEILSQTKLF